MTQSTPNPDAFISLHPSVQKQLWKMAWPALRPLQEKSIREILATPNHIIITASTASGKTEAAFLPVLSKIADEPAGSVRALYVGPLKALINDQFSRLEELCNYLQMPVHRWHGDASAADKAELVKNPSGVLLITPESLESLLINRSRNLPSLFGGLRFIVIDEMHAFLDNPRGLHLQSLISRVRRCAAVPPPPRLIGLSATIGDGSIARRWIGQDDPSAVTIVSDSSPPKETKFKLHAYRIENDDAAAADQCLGQDLVKHCTGASNLIFANSKADVEVFAEMCSTLAAAQGLPDQFLVHHGSLSAEMRQDAETILKSGKPTTAFCSSTLEMGIDIGSIRMVGQIGAPSSAASLKQRLGRSGRRGDEPRILRIYLRAKTPAPDADFLGRLHLNLIQAVAVSDLLLSGWVESPQPPVCDLSTLSQQIISVIAQTSAASAGTLYQTLCAAGAFRAIDPGLFAKVLRALAAGDVIEQAPAGELILGLKGEQIRKDKSFYAVFQTPQPFKVIAEGRPLGELAIVPRLNDHVLLGGRRWQVISIDADHRELVVKASGGGKRPLFLGDGSDLHPHICHTMRQILATSDAKSYLDESAASLLSESRRSAAAVDACNQPLIPLDSTRTAWMTWSGSRTSQTLQAMLAARGVRAQDKLIALEIDLPQSQVSGLIAELSAAPPDPNLLARQVSPRQRGKFDSLLNDELLDESILRDRLDIGQAKRIIDSSNQNA